LSPASISSNRHTGLQLILEQTIRQLPESIKNFASPSLISQNLKERNSLVKLRWTSRISAASEKANEEEVLVAKASYLGFWSAMGGYTRELWRASQPTISWPLSERKQERKGSVYYSDTFKSYNSLKRLGKHLTVNHSKNMVDKRTKNHINGIEGFWSFAKHILYNYRGVSKYHFPLYLKEVEYRFNHRNENLFKLFLSIYFGYVSP
jgi:transposase-like protein